jgi:hypothetical protein
MSVCVWDEGYRYNAYSASHQLIWRPSALIWLCDKYKEQMELEKTKKNNKWKALLPYAVQL